MDKQSQKVHDLIYFITHNKKLTREQQTKRDRLLARDCGFVAENIDCTLPVGFANIISDKSKGQYLEEKKTRYTPPKNLHDFLYCLNQDGILRYICHEIDTDEAIEDINELCNTNKYSLKKHSQQICQAFEYLCNDFQRKKKYIDDKFYAMLKAYICGNSKGWSSLGITTCWTSDELLAWGEQNLGIIPSPGKNIAKKQKNPGYKLSKSLMSPLNGVRILYFKDIVLYFKSLFHIRRDNSLRKIIEFQNKNIEGFNISFAENQFNDSVELLADVDKLIQAYKAILRICKDANDDEVVNIELGFYETNNSVCFTIHDTDHCYNKSLKSALERIGESQTKLIKNQINGLCDLYIEADFGNQDYARIGLWTQKSRSLGDSPIIPVERIQEAKGVKYILKFTWE